MERVRRRWWTWIVSLSAALVILAALISGVFQLAVLALPDYREDLSAWVTRVAGRPVQIGGIGLSWRGVNPRLDLSDITLYSVDGEQETLTAERLSLRFGWLRLVTGDFSPQRVVLSGLSLGVRVDPEGRVSVAGFERRRDLPAPDLRTWLRELERFGSVSLERCSVDFEDERPGRQKQLRFGVESIAIDIDGQGFEVEAQAQLPATYGDALEFESRVNGLLSEPEHWNGDFSLRATGLLPQPWLRGRVAPGTRVAAEDVEAQAEGRFAAGRLSQVQLELESGSLLAARAGREVRSEGVELSLLAAAEQDGWRLDLSNLALDGDAQLQGQLRYRPLAESGYELSADLPTLQLQRLAPWLQFVRDLPPDLARLSDLSGRLQGLVLRLQRSGEQRRYSVRVELQALELPGNDERAGFAGLGGELSADETGGRLRLAAAPPRLHLPRTFSQDLSFDQLDGELRWQRSGEGWRLSAPRFDWKLAGTTGRGQLDLLLPGAEGVSPEIDLGATFAAGDIVALKPYMPRRWSENLRGWLDRALLAGNVPRAQLRLRGPLAQFPFREGGGEWKLDLDLIRARIAYAPQWPVIDNLRAQLRFSGNGLRVESDAADLGAGLRAQRVVASLDDFRDQRLKLDGNVSGGLAGYYTFLRNSPLRERLAGLLDRTHAAGPARLALRLDVPLLETAQTAASGTITLDGAQMYYAGLQQPVSDIRGDIAFNNTGISAQRLRARFEELDLEAQIEPRPQTRGVIQAQFAFAPRADGTGVSRYVPALLRPALSGSSAWRAELPLALGDAPAELVLSSDLQGTAAALPRPLGKEAGDSAPLRIALGAAEGGEAGVLRLRLGYAGRLSGDITLAPTPTPDGSGPSELTATGISLQFGGGVAPRLREGISIGGELAELDVPAWTAAFGGLVRGATSGGPGTPRSFDVQAQRLQFPGQFIRDTRLVYRPYAEGWALRLTGSGAEGDVFWTAADGGRLSLDLSRLELEKTPVEEGAAKKTARPALNPAEWPLFEVSCARCRLDGADFGRIKLNTVRVPGGQKLEYFTAQNGTVEAYASGEWLRGGEGSTAQLKFELASPDFTTVLSSLGYAPNVAAKNTRLSGELGWLPSPAGIAWEQARGNIGLNFEKGTLKAVDPGAGRVLGLLNFYALPRRLTLDFRDVVRSGLAFDKITGTFALADGAAVTDNLRIDAPSLRMEMQGRIGLVARDYDQRVSVYPDVSSGITLGAALLGGPALGALAFLAQEVLDKPIEQATHLDYRVTGSWDNPEIRKIEDEVPPTPAPASAAPAAPAAPPVALPAPNRPR